MKFTIGTVSSSLGFEEDLNLIKSSLLYADEVELIGMAEYAVFNYIPQCINTPNNINQMMDEMISLLHFIDSDDSHELLNQIIEAKETLSPYLPMLNKKKYRNKQEILAQIQVQKLFDECRDRLNDGIKILFDKDGARQILNLINDNIISVFDYGIAEPSFDKLAGGYFGCLLGTLKKNATYPLFDKTSNQAIASILNNNKIDFGDIDREVLRHAGISTNILMTLPGLEKASIDEILDFKKENNDLLIGFRKAVYSFSEQVKTFPWDIDFEYECMKLYHKEVLPKVEELNSIATDTSVAKNMGREFLHDAEIRKSSKFITAGLASTITTTAGMVSALNAIEKCVLGLSLVILAPATVEAFLKTIQLFSEAKAKTKETNNKMVENTMYYYYKAKNKFS